MKNKLNLGLKCTTSDGLDETSEIITCEKNENLCVTYAFPDSTTTGCASLEELQRWW